MSNYRTRERRRAKQNQAERELANKVHELESKLLFAEQPFRAQISHLTVRISELEQKLVDQTDMLLWCPECGERHIDELFKDRVHHTHACQHCGHCWRPAVAPTRGVRFLPGFKDPT